MKFAVQKHFVNVLIFFSDRRIIIVSKKILFWPYYLDFPFRMSLYVNNQTLYWKIKRLRIQKQN